MAALTTLQLTNAVLRRLRESEVTVLTADYTKLIVDFINEAKREVEDAWNWSALRTNISINTVGGTSNYTLTGSNHRTRILAVYNSTKQYEMIRAADQFIARQQLLATTTNQDPDFYRIRGLSATGELKVDLFPTPNSAQTLNFQVVVPQAELSVVGTVLTVPDYPVILGAWAKAISERGEDGGANTSEAFGMYQQALSDAIAQDEARTVGETDWVVY